MFCESFAADGVKDVAILAEDTVTIKSLNDYLLDGDGRLREHRHAGGRRR